MKKLKFLNASAALLLTEDRRVVLQHRDDVSGIWYPDHWGCFGGATEPGESYHETIVRELWEELSISVSDLHFFMDQHYKILDNYFTRKFFIARLDDEQIKQIKLSEGQAWNQFSKAEAVALKMAPYDKFALDLFFMREESALEISEI